jgi:hypothetical protein
MTKSSQIKFKTASYEPAGFLCHASHASNNGMLPYQTKNK